MVFWLLTKKKSRRISVEPGLNSVKVSYAPDCTWEVAMFKNNYKDKIKKGEFYNSEMLQNKLCTPNGA